MCIVKPDGPPQLCKTDEIGEIVINSRAGGTMYYGLPGVTKNTFEVCQSLKSSVLVRLQYEQVASYGEKYMAWGKNYILKPHTNYNCT